jgi:ABC-type amino acid transport system permease subunit
VHWFKHQQPLDRTAARVRWFGTAICATLIAVVFLIFKAMGKPWVHEHVALLVISSGIPIYMFLFFIFFPGLSRWLGRRLEMRS